jgi:hypothetical protein
MSNHLTITFGLLFIAVTSACGPSALLGPEARKDVLGPPRSEEGLQTAIAESADSSEDARFTLILNLDAYGMFMPINNQFRSSTSLPVSPFYSGFFVQLSDFLGALHSYDVVLLEFADGNKKEVFRPDFQWIDVVCAANWPQVLTPARASELLPQAAGDGRLLHTDMDWERTSLITLWKGEEGVSVEITSEESGVVESRHSHDTFTFRSKTSCAVRIWKALGAGGPPDTEYLPVEPATHVTKIEVKEGSFPSPHGEVHHPPWG